MRKDKKQMSITVVCPPKIRFIYPILVYRTWKYFKENAESMTIRVDTSIVTGRNKFYHIFVYRYNLRLCFELQDSKTISFLENYLDYIFKDSYIGLDKKHNGLFNLKKTRIVYI